MTLQEIAHLSKPPRTEKTSTAKPQVDVVQALIPKAEEAEHFLKAIANAHRLMVLCELHKGEICVTDLQNAIGLSQSALSQHLARLRSDGLVQTRRDSRTIYYSLADERVKRIISLLHEVFCGK
jgi:ArsR family transcriptional regulator, virulence genes transcriptional regulator